jgi:hypothetical protein
VTSIRRIALALAPRMLAAGPVVAPAAVAQQSAEGLSEQVANPVLGIHFVIVGNL